MWRISISVDRRAEADRLPKGRKQIGEAVNRKTTKKYPGGELRPQEKAAREGQLFLV